MSVKTSKVNIKEHFYLDSQWDDPSNCITSLMFSIYTHVKLALGTWTANILPLQAEASDSQVNLPHLN